jgi:TonB family protein
MRSRRRVAGVLWCSLVLLLGSPARSDNWRNGLDGPLTPGSVALLVEHASDPAVPPRWSQALRDPRAAVRAAAARGIYASARRALAADLTEALKAETDTTAAREEMRALVSLGGPATVQTALDAAGRLGNDYSMALAATGHDAATLTRVGVIALRGRNAALWKQALAAALASRSEVDLGVVNAALTSDEPTLRRTALWYLVLSQRRIESPPEARSEAVGTDESTAFAVELLNRLRGRPAVEREQWTAGLADRARLDLPLGVVNARALVRILTPAERESLRLRVAGDKNWPEPPKGAETPMADRVPPEASLSAIGNLPPGLAIDTFRAAGCNFGNGQGWIAANVEYREDRLPQKVAVWLTLSGGCLEAARALFVLALPPYREWSPKDQVVVIALDPKVLECGTELDPRRSAPLPLGVGSRITEPRKLSDVKPVYPHAAKEKGIQGTVILEATITPSGCIGELRVLKSVDPSLDLAALLAVLRWRYTPTLLDGVPVPVIMTITVNFRLS